jgi:hypothetical protein
MLDKEELIDIHENNKYDVNYMDTQASVGLWDIDIEF